MFEYRFGIEEEFFVTDLKTRNVRRTMSSAYYKACKAALGAFVTTEMLQAQIEVMTPPCETMGQARDHLGKVRTALNECSAAYGLGIVAAGTHPLAVWPEQIQTQKRRYNEMMVDLQMVGLRNMVCGTHVHVEVPDPSRRVELMYRAIPYLPLLLALSTSSPFWQGRRTGLLGYRLTAYDELPRTGLPEHFQTSDEYRRYVDTLTAAGVIKDESYIWWAIRPSMRHPTLELRVADSCTHVDDAVCVAALFRCLIRHLVNDPRLNANLDAVDRAIAEENKWRAQRYGACATFVDRAATTARSTESVLKDVLDRIAPDAKALRCEEEVGHAATILRRGSSADEQLRVYANARASDKSRQAALRDVVDWLIGETALP